MLTCDLQDKNAISMLPQYIDTQIDGIIYSAGLGYFKSISQHSTNEMLETYEVNIIGFNLLLHALLPYLSKHASIVGISSQAKIHHTSKCVLIMVHLKLLLMQF